MASASAWRWRPIAPSAPDAFETSWLEVVAALGQEAGERGGVDDQALEGAGVARELAEDAARGGEQRVEVLRALVRLLRPRPRTSPGSR